MPRKRNKKPRVIKCEVCGREITVTHNRTKYCPECREAVAAEWARKQRAKQRGGGEPEDIQIHFCDPPEMISMCLSCTRPRCGGDCELMRTKGIRTRGRYKNGN